MESVQSHEPWNKGKMFGERLPEPLSGTRHNLRDIARELHVDNAVRHGFTMCRTCVWRIRKLRRTAPSCRYVKLYITAPGGQPGFLEAVVLWFRQDYASKARSQESGSKPDFSKFGKDMVPKRGKIMLPGTRSSANWAPGGEKCLKITRAINNGAGFRAII